MTIFIIILSVKHHNFACRSLLSSEILLWMLEFSVTLNICHPSQVAMWEVGPTNAVFPPFLGHFSRSQQWIYNAKPLLIFIYENFIIEYLNLLKWFLFVKIRFHNQILEQYLATRHTTHFINNCEQTRFAGTIWQLICFKRWLQKFVFLNLSGHLVIVKTVTCLRKKCLCK